MAPTAHQRLLALGQVRLSSDDEVWLARFHAGERGVLGSIYDEHFSTVDLAVARVLLGADRETVVHEVFLRLLSNPQLRQSFKGGSFGGWVATVARNQAIDFARRRNKEQPLESATAAEAVEPFAAAGEVERRAEARMLIDRFRKEYLPAKWKDVFELRFLEQLDQRTAAERLGMGRTTLAYQELRIRALLRRFMLSLSMEQR